MRPNILVQLSKREDVESFRSGLGDTRGVTVLGLDPKTLWRLAGLDALYLSLPRAEQWGSRLIPPHEAALLRTTAEELQSGMPPYIVTGLILNEDDPNTASFLIPILMDAVLRVVERQNTTHPGAIRSIGFFEYELKLPGITLDDVGRAFGQALATR